MMKKHTFCKQVCLREELLQEMEFCNVKNKILTVECTGVWETNRRLVSKTPFSTIKISHWLRRKLGVPQVKMTNVG